MNNSLEKGNFSSEVRKDLDSLFFAWKNYLRREIFILRQKYRFAVTGLLTFALFIIGILWLMRSTVYGYTPVSPYVSNQLAPMYRFFSFVISSSIIGFSLFSLRRYYGVFKRIFDLIVAASVLICLSPLFVIVALLIKIDSAGPVFFKQQRLGKDRKPFTILKFRSMRQDAELATGAVWAQENDPRVTRLGNFLRKSHLDEIPQLINVLRGHMSIVGPRPERAEMMHVIVRQIPEFDKRLLVKPGITGLAQVRYNYGASIKDAARKLKYDIIYIQRQCWLIDFQIMFWTVRRVLTGEGAR